MGYWGKIIGGVAGFAVGGPVGALVGAAVGHAADQGTLPGQGNAGGPGMFGFGPARVAQFFGKRDQLFAVGITVIAAKLAKCDGPVVRAEIDAFKRHFQIPDGNVKQVGMLFDQARDSAEGFEVYARQLGAAFADNRGLLEQVMASLYAIARADGAVNGAEADFLARVAAGLGLPPGTGSRGGFAQSQQADPYAVLGLRREAGDAEVRARWKQLMRENHPDSLAARGVPRDFIEAASDRVARINAAYDVIKRERGL